MCYRWRCLIGAVSFFLLVLSLNPSLHADPLLLVSQYTAGQGSGYGVASVDSTGAVSQFVTLNPTGFAAQMAYDNSGNLLVANTHQGNILQITPAGAVSVFASGIGEATGLVRANDGSFYYASDASTSTIKKVSLTGVVTPFASLAAGAFPQWLTQDASGNLYVSNALGHTINEISPAGSVTTLASGIAEPEGIAFDQSGTLFVADYMGMSIDKVTAQGVVTPFVTGLPGNPDGMAFGPNGNLFVALDQGEVVEVSPGGTVSTFATGLREANGLLFTTPEPSSLLLGCVAMTGCAAMNGVRRIRNRRRVS